MVMFENAERSKKRYRRFRIKTVHQADDYAMMREVLTRRYRRGMKEDDLPDLVLVDGGKGQLGVAVEVLEGLGVEGVGIAALAKGRSRRSSAADRMIGDAERVFVPGSSRPVEMPPGCAEMMLLQRIRDEAHRFAVAYHRRVRRREEIEAASPLRNIKGVGRRRRQLLLERFGSSQGVLRATQEELAQVKGIGPSLARKIHGQLHPGAGTSG